MALPTKEQEALAVALHIERQYGKGGPRYIAERIGVAMIERDTEQIEFWKDVDIQYQQLIKTSDIRSA